MKTYAIRTPTEALVKSFSLGAISWEGTAMEIAGYCNLFEGGATIIKHALGNVGGDINSLFCDLVSNLVTVEDAKAICGLH